MELLLNSLFFIVMFFFWINFVGYHRLDKEEWELIKELRDLSDLELDTEDEK